MHAYAEMRLKTGRLARLCSLHDAMLNGEENTWWCDWLAQRPVIQNVTEYGIQKTEDRRTPGSDAGHIALSLSRTNRSLVSPRARHQPTGQRGHWIPTTWTGGGGAVAGALQPGYFQFDPRHGLLWPSPYVPCVPALPCPALLTGPVLLHPRFSHACVTRQQR